MSKDNELIYTSGEASLFLSIIRDSLKKINSSEAAYSYLSDFQGAVRDISTRYKKLSAGYLDVLQKNSLCKRNPNHVKVLHTLFNEPFDKIPLLMGDPILGVIVRFRLAVGR